jgi:uncharacterized OB-fold protein
MEKQKWKGAQNSKCGSCGEIRFCRNGACHDCRDFEADQLRAMRKMESKNRAKMKAALSAIRGFMQESGQ